MLVVLLIACGLTLATVGTHYFVLTNLSSFLLEREFQTRKWVGFSILVMIFAHVFEVTIFSFGYAMLDGHEDFGELIANSAEVETVGDELADYWYFSFVVYTSLGFGDITPKHNLRLITAFETLTGLIMIAWSASFIYMQMQRCWTGDEPPRREDLPDLR